MKNSKTGIELLHTVLSLEQQRNYADTVVIGGIDKFIDKWTLDNVEIAPSKKLKTQFTKLFRSSHEYKTWDRAQRKVWLDGLLDWIIDFSNETLVVTKDEIMNLSSDNKYRKSARKNIEQNKLLLDSPVTVIKGIKENFTEKLNKLGVYSIRDLLYFFPRYHLDYSQKKYIADLFSNDTENKEMETQTVIVNVWEANIINLGYRRMRATELIIGDETGNASAIWYNQPYLAKRFYPNSKIVISGKYKIFKGKIAFQSPDWDFYDKELIHAGRLVPVYSLTSGLYQRQLRNLIKKTIDIWVAQLSDFIPSTIKQRCNLIDLAIAIQQAHFPENQESKANARKRLAFDELFLLQLGMLKKKNSWLNYSPGTIIEIQANKLNSFIYSLPFKLTHSQENVLSEILADLRQTKPMSRLLQGEVGSGKTIIAIATLLAAVNSDCQAVLMAPTELLAEQHFHNVCNLLSKTCTAINGDENVVFFEGLLEKTIGVALLAGRKNNKERVEIYQGILSGNLNIIIGTHAIIQEGVEFKKLGLAVIDEQHRFGVQQRNTLRQKGINPHILVMSATPIPRTLALTLYGDLDISVLDELPPGRQEIKTRWINSENRDIAYEFIKKQVDEGHQAFIICPLIEESANIEAKAAVVEFKRLSQEIFSEYRLGLLHGRLPLEVKEEVMKNFRDNKFNILVATPVVEVGIDIPNATIILIEAADRFGLSQLHQFRGRVGRGKSQSYCILIAEKPTDIGKERLKSIEKIYNGFELAEKDLELRGPGEFFGTKQSGLPDLSMAKLSDVLLIEIARKEANLIFLDDPNFILPENKLLYNELIRIWPKDAEWS